MFSSAKKYLEESAKSATSGADQLYTHTKGYINTVKVYENCSKCSTQINMLGNYLTSQNQCRMCSKLFCNACIAKSAVNVPNHLLDITFQNKTAHAQPERQFLCLHRCTPRVVNACMLAFRKEITCRFEDYVNAFLAEEKKQHFFFSIPSASPEDTAYRKALRMIHIAGVVAGMTGYAMTYNAVKYAYYSSELVNILTEGGILSILTPLLESLKECGIGISGPTALMRLYYLGCYHTLQSKIDTTRRSLLYTPEKTGVLYSECPLAVLQYVNSYLSAAQWMYLSSLPPPHQDNDWGSWYLSQIIRRQGWSLLMCINESTKIPDGSKCPAFALVTRCVGGGEDGEGDEEPPLREAMLVIRGSNSIMDWSINLEDGMCDYVYTHVVDCDSWKAKCSTAEGSSEGSGVVGGDGTGSGLGSGSAFNVTHPNNTTNTNTDTNTDTNSADTHYTHTVHGIIHKGLYTAAMGLLDGYNLRTTLLRLLSKGYSVKVVGHSLGAGIAALIAAELRVTLVAQQLGLYDGTSGGGSVSVKSEYGFSTRSSSTAFGNDSTKNTTTDTTSTKVPEPHSPTSPTPLKGVQRPDSGVAIPSAVLPTLLHTVSSISAVIFSSPAFVSADLADAFLEDRLLVNVVYDKDIIPRFSFKTIQVMAEELKDPDFCSQADKWTALDKSDFSDYAVSMGKAADIHKPTYGSAAEPAVEVTTATAAAGPGLQAVPLMTAAVESGSGGEAKGTDTTAQAPAKPSKPPKAAKPDTSASTTTGLSAGASNITTTTTSTATNATTTSATSTTTSTVSTGGTWSGFVTSLAATAIDKYHTTSSGKAGAAGTDTTAAATTSATAATTVQEQLDSTAATAPLHSVDQKASQVQQTAHAVGTGSSAEVKQKAPRAHTVTPGPIIHLYKENDGTVHGAVVTHEHAAFQRIEIIPAHSADDHLMGKTRTPLLFCDHLLPQVREGMRSAMFQHQLLTHTHGSGGTSGGTSGGASFGTSDGASGGTSAHYSAAPHTTGTNTTLPSSTTHNTTNTTNTTNNTNNTNFAGTTTTCNLEEEGSAEVNQSQEERAKFERYFNIPIHGSVRGGAGGGSGVVKSGVKRGVENVEESGNASPSGGVAAGASGGSMPGRPSKAYRSISAENAITSGGVGVGVGVGVGGGVGGVMHSTKSSISANIGTSGTSDAVGDSSKNNIPGTGATPTSSTNVTRAAQQWVNCSVCTLDVTWPYVLHSDASRAIVAHNCRKCGEVVCSMCAPAGDTLPGDGLNQSYQLQDYRVSLPERGLFAPQRVCVLCYFDT